MQDGKFVGNAPGWVDVAKPPGATSQDAAYCPSPTWWKVMFSGYDVIFGPNFVWLIIALLNYALFPYDLEAAASGFSIRWILKRAAINVGITFAYTGYWHFILYWLGAAKRPFKPDRKWRWGKVLHNLWYALLGCLQWTGWEVVFMTAYATGKLPYLDDAAAFGTARGFANMSSGKDAAGGGLYASSSATSLSEPSSSSSLASRSSAQRRCCDEPAFAVAALVWHRAVARSYRRDEQARRAHRAPHLAISRVW